MSPERNFTQALRFSELVLAHEFTEYRCIDPARKRPTLSFWGVLNTEEDFADLIKENAKGYGVFAVINRLPPEMEAHIVAEDQRAARDEDVTGVRAFFVEIDRAEASPGDNLRALQNAPLRPSLIVQSSLPHKLHAYWLVDGVSIEEFQALQAALIALFGGDPACKNLSRVMRVPGFLHTKGEPLLTTILDDNGARYSRDEMLNTFPCLQGALDAETERQARREQAKERLRERPRVDADHARRYALSALQREHDTVAAAPDGTRNNTLNKAAFSLGQLVAAGALERHEVEDALNAAAADFPNPKLTAHTIRSGLEAGLKEPREVPEPKKTKDWMEAKREKRKTGGTGSKGGRPKIQVNDRRLREITEDALAALKAVNEPPFLFVRGSLAARVNTETKVEALTQAALKGVLDRAADFFKLEFKKGEDGKPVEEQKPARPPGDVAPDILALPDIPFPRLEGVAHVPTFLPGGVLLAVDGYDPESGLLLRLRGLEGVRADMPTSEALSLLDEVFGDFPFAEEAGRAHALALTLQPFVRPLIPGPTPLYLIDAPARGTGKGLLSESAALIVTGKAAPIMALPREEDETEKRITAALLEGAPFLLMDNVTHLRSTSLAAALTSEYWRGRRLGKSEMIEVRNDTTWLATGNNVGLSDELTRRVIPIRLDAGVERPEERRGFKHKNLPVWVKAHRTELVSACLSLVQVWVAEGMPHADKVLGRYELWAGVIGGILSVSGVSGFLSGRERLYQEADKETTEWASLCEAWWQSYGERPVTAKDLFEIVKDRGLLLDVWGGRTAQGALQRIGHALGSRRDRVFGGYALRNAGRDAQTRNAAYRLEGVKKTPETPETPGAVPETLSSTAIEGRVFSGCFDENDPKTPGGETETPGGTNHVQHGISDTSRGVSGVSGVLNRPQKNELELDDLSHLIGATEGEL